MALPLFAITLFVSAFLLFLVQPMIGKMILPKLGGTPQVWNTCMVFFQTVLLAGYAYTHYSTTRLSRNKQLYLHLGLLALPLLFLLPFGPFNIENWNPPSEGSPVFSALLILTIVVGVPFFVVSTSAPLLQRWFSHTGHPSANDPYFLYAASNLGSLLSLLFYPILVEPMLTLAEQRWTWTVSYLILAGLIVACCVAVMKVIRGSPLSRLALDAGAAGASTDIAVAKAPEPERAPVTAITATAPAAPQKTGIKKKGPRHLGRVVHAPLPEPEFAKPLSDDVTPLRRLRWVLLAAIPVSLMLGVTTYVSVDLSPFPLLWVIPLALYLLTFILVFSKWPMPWTETPHQVLLFVGPLGIVMITYIQLAGGFDPLRATLISFAGFFLVVMVCHGELARDRPSSRHLTEFFLLMSFGGMLGGMFNALFAPIFFNGIAEYPIAIVVACFLFPRQRESGWFEELIFAAFPNLKDYMTRVGDDMARSRGKTPPGTPYVFSYVVDVVLGLALILALSNVTRNMYHFENFRTPQAERVEGLAKFFGVTFDLRFGAEQKKMQGWSNALAYGVPLVFCFFYGTRPVRFGLAVLSLIAVNLVFHGESRGNVLEGGARRTYFGVLRVSWRGEEVLRRLEGGGIRRGDVSIEKGGTLKNIPLSSPVGKTTQLMHGTTHHGMNFHYPPELHRLATTYYHRLGPVGAIMERYNWFPGPQNTFTADARMPASLIMDLASPLGIGNLPLNTVVQANSEPPYATIGLGTGTMASYGRWLQHVVFYEIDSVVRGFSEPFDVKPGDEVLRMDAFEDKIQKPYFTYLRDAALRGANVEVIMGDAWLSMSREEPQLSKLFHMRNNYYKVIVVDAFSSDAIPIHLVTREAMELYVSKLAPDGIILMHTSNRHLDLVEPVVDIAVDMGLDWRVCKDRGERDSYLGLFSSEYVVLAKDRTILKDIFKLPDDAPKETQEGTRGKIGGLTKDQGCLVEYYKQRRTEPLRRVWTRDFSNIWSIIRWGH